jgi:hypothetical protein
MNSKQKSTLKKIFESPTRSDISWNEIEILFKALGAEISEGNGSRIRIALNGVRAVFHKPHPKKEVNKSSVNSICRFLIEGGINNDDL